MYPQIYLFIFLTALIVFTLLVGLFILFKQLRKIKDGQSKEDSLGLMQQQIDNLRTQIDASMDRLKTTLSSGLTQITGQVGQRLDSATNVIGSVQRQLGELQEANHHILEIGKDISSLQDILRPPKIRGGMGELLLKNLLDQIMPGQDYYSFEYSFKNGNRVDAVIKIGDRLVPVDSKFPLESFRRISETKNGQERKKHRKDFDRDVKKHIDAIADKYILPDEGTYEFALMYIPAENVYYETIIKYDDEDAKQGIFEHALNKKVIPVSPNSFYAYLQVIIMGLKGLAIEKSTKEIIVTLERLQGDFSRFYDDFRKIGAHIDDSKSSFSRAEKRLDRLGEKLTNIERPKDKAKING